MSNEREKCSTRIQSKLDRIQESLECNPNVVVYRNEYQINPPQRGFAHAVTLDVAPITPITESAKLSRFANNLSDLKPSKYNNASQYCYKIGEAPHFHYARVEFIETVAVIDIKITKTPTIISEIQGLSAEEFAQEDSRRSVLKRKILMVVYPHQKIAELVHRYEKSDIENKELQELTNSVSAEQLEALVNEENPFSHLENF